MRRTLALVSLSLAASALAFAPPAAAKPVADHSTAARGGLSCPVGVISADTKGRVRYDSVLNDKVENTLGSKNRLGFTVDAWGEYTDTAVKGTRKLTMTSVTSQGIRLVTLSIAKGKKIVLSATKPVQDFDPVLFADNYYFYGYTVSGSGQLQRWTWTRYPSGKLRFADKVVVGKGFGDVTSLQASALFEKNKVWKQPLYATTESGALLQIVVPVKKPTDEKVRELVSSGYAGVTELSWGICNKSYDNVVLVAVDPVTGIGTWTTIKDANGKPKTTLQGEITGGKGWKNVTALY